MLHLFALLFLSLQPQCGAFLSWVWQWSMPSLSLESSSYLWWRHAIWNTYSTFSSLLPLAHCSPLPSCSCCQRFAIYPYVFHLISLNLCFSKTRTPKLKASLVHCSVMCHMLFTKLVHIWPCASLSFLWSYVFPSCFCLLSVVFSGSYKHGGRWKAFLFALPFLHHWSSRIVFMCMCAPFLALRCRPPMRSWSQR